MPAEESTPAIVLRARDYAESDRIVTLLTRDHGKLAGIAKGAKASRHRFERKLEPFSHVILHFRRRPHGQLVFITRAEAADLAQYPIDEDLGRIALGAYMLEIADALTAPEGEAAEAYRILTDAMAALSLGSADAALRQAFELQMFGWAGFGLDFERCRICGDQQGAETRALYFVVGRGGVVCPRCRPSLADGAIKLRPETAATLARLGRSSLAGARGATPAGSDGTAALARFINSILDRKLRSAEFLDSMIESVGR
ncbi:MAG: DNA repair protein RecO [Candidatus Binataceae bacterium]